MNLSGSQFILFPSDLSERSGACFRQILDHLGNREVVLLVLHCYRLIGQASDSMSLKEQLEQQAKQDFEHWVADLPSHTNVDIRFEAVPGFYRNRITSAAQKYPVDLLVLCGEILAELGPTEMEAMEGLRTISCNMLLVPDSFENGVLRTASVG